MKAHPGLHERVELLGEEFDVQTELLDGETGTVRTVIFHRGEVRARQESCLRRGPGGGGDGELDERIQAYHRGVLEHFVQRALGFEARAAGEDLAVASLPVAQARADESVPELPPVPEDPAVADAIELRRLVGGLLARLDLTPIEEATESQGLRWWLGRIGRRLTGSVPEGGLADRLEAARQAFGWAAVQPALRRLRMDEQVRFNLLRERLGEAPTDPETRRELWQDLVTLCDYLREVNLRVDLVEFDRHLLTWAAASIWRTGISRGILKSLRWIEGRDPTLDALLAQEKPAEAELLRELERIRSAI